MRKQSVVVSALPAGSAQKGVPGSQGGGSRGSTMPAFSPGVRPRAARLMVWAMSAAAGPHSTTARSSDARTAHREGSGDRQTHSTCLTRHQVQFEPTSKASRLKFLWFLEIHWSITHDAVRSNSCAGQGSHLSETPALRGRGLPAAPLPARLGAPPDRHRRCRCHWRCHRCCCHWQAA